MKELKETLEGKEANKDAIVPNWEDMYKGLMKNYEELQNAHEELRKILQNQNILIQQHEITIRTLCAIVNK